MSIVQGHDGRMYQLVELTEAIRQGDRWVVIKHSRGVGTSTVVATYNDSYKAYLDAAQREAKATGNKLSPDQRANPKYAPASFSNSPTFGVIDLEQGAYELVTGVSGQPPFLRPVVKRG